MEKLLFSISNNNFFIILILSSLIIVWNLIDNELNRRAEQGYLFGGLKT